MFYRKWQHYSYTAQRHQRHRLMVIFSWILGIFLLYLVITNYLFFTFTVESKSMETYLMSGDVGLALSTRLFSKDDDSSFFPFKRGTIVVLEKSFNNIKKSWYSRFMDDCIDFFTAQQKKSPNESQRMFIKRIIALPGDEVSILNHIVRVKPANQNYTLTEFELSAVPYDIKIPEMTTLGSALLPFSPNMEPVLLREGECFVLSDDRADCNDSRTWGPVLLSDILGKPVFRYWPLSRLGPL